MYIHCPPIMKDAHQKLSKRNGDASFMDLVDKGYLVDAILNYIALLGWSPRGNEEFFTLKELEKEFSLDGLSKSPAIFDIEKLKWMNGEYIRRLSPEEFRKAADNGDGYSMNAIAAMYRYGQGVRKNHNTALTWYGKAIDAGVESARTAKAELEAQIESKRERKRQYARDHSSSRKSSNFGLVAGGAIGFAVGGPLGALAGGFIGSFFED